MKRYVPMRNAEDPHHVELMPVSEEVYAEITRETSRIRNKMQYHGRCVCPKKYLWKCDGDCSLCEYSAAGDNLSLDYGSELHGEHFSDGSDIEEMVTDKLMMNGQVGFLASQRVDGKLILPEAVKTLTIKKA